LTGRSRVGVSRERVSWYLYLVLSAAFAAIMLATWLLSRSINGRDCATYIEIISGTACKPFAYRVLVPLLVRISQYLVPGSLHESIRASLVQQPVVQRAFSLLIWDTTLAFEYLLGVGWLYVAVYGFILSLKYLFDGLFRTPNEWFSRIVPWVALLGIRYLMRYVSYVYDLPALFLFTLGLALMARKQWRAFLLVFLLASLNKETTILLTLVFVIHQWHVRRLEDRQFQFLLVAQLSIFALVKGVLFVIFRENPGTFVEMHLLDHNIDLLRKFLLRPSLAAEFPWMGLALLVFHNWPNKSRFLKDAIWILVPIFAMMPFLGMLDELRVYYEVVPIVVLLATQSVAEIVGIDIHVIGSEKRGTI